MSLTTMHTAPTRPGPSTAALWANMAVVYVVWGSTYFGIAIAIESPGLPPFLMAAIRFTIAGLLLVGFDLLRHPEARGLPTRRQVVDSIVVGGLLLGVGNGFVVFGQQTVPSGIAAILIEMTPLWLAVFGFLYLRQRLSRAVVVAIAVGSAGTLLLIWPTGEGANVLDPLGIVMLLLAELGWVHGSIYSIRRARLPASPLSASGIQMLAGGAVTGLEGVLAGEPARFNPSRDLDGLGARGGLPDRLRQHARVHVVRLAPPTRAAPPGGHSRVREPDRGGRARDPLPARAADVRTIIASAVILVAVAIIVSARDGGARDASARERPPAEPA